jgi:large subunit ribosomal protein L1
LRKNIRKERFSKRFIELTKQVDKDQLYTVEEAISLLKKTASAKFKETVDVAVRLGIDPKKGDQNVRGLLNLPHGTGKKKTVAVLAKGDQAAEAEKAGAETVGADDLIAKIQNGFKDFDIILATPEMAPQIGKIGRILGTKTPNKRNGTVTDAVGQAVKEIKAATRVEYRTDKAGIVHMPLGKTEFTEAQIVENFNTALDALLKAKPSSAKGKYLKGITISSTMGPGIAIDTSIVQKALG